MRRQAKKCNDQFNIDHRTADAIASEDGTPTLSNDIRLPAALLGVSCEPPAPSPVDVGVGGGGMGVLVLGEVVSVPMNSKQDFLPASSTWFSQHASASQKL